MSSSTRFVAESPLYQGSNEQVAYIFQWSAVGTPSSPVIVLYDLATNGTLPAATYLSGTASVSGTDVTTPLVKGLTPWKHYLLNCAVTVNGNIFSSNCEIIGEV